MKGRDLSFTIPKPYLIGRLSTSVVIFLSINLFIFYYLWYVGYFRNYLIENIQLWLLHSWWTFVCKVTTLGITNPLLQNSFHCDVDLLIVSSYLLTQPGCPSVSRELLVGSLGDLPQLELYIFLIRGMR